MTSHGTIGWLGPAATSALVSEAAGEVEFPGSQGVVVRNPLELALGATAFTE